MFAANNRFGSGNNRLRAANDNLLTENDRLRSLHDLVRQENDRLRRQADCGGWAIRVPLAEKIESWTDLIAGGIEVLVSQCI